MKKFSIYIALFLTFTCSAAMMAEQVTEDFESVELLNTDSYGRTTELSNGWTVVGGYISTKYGSDYTEYSMVAGYNDSKQALTAQYSSSNNAFVVLPDVVEGDFTFYARKTSSSSSTKGIIKLCAITEEETAGGVTYTRGADIETINSLTTSWTQYTIKVTTPTKVALNMVRSSIDDIVYDVHEGPVTALTHVEAATDGRVYNLMGQPVSAPQAGQVYIVGQKKVLWTK